MRTRTRAGFTLVELMVAMALTLFIMVILSQAFVLSLETFSGMKGVGDMQINLRVATNLLRDDLGQDHFEGKRRLSDVDAAGNPQMLAQPPQAGFLAVIQRSNPSAAGPGYINEGNDTNGLGSFRANDHILYMTCKRKGNRQENFYTTSLAGTAAQLNAFFGQNTAYDVASANLSNQTMTVPHVAGSPTGFYSSQWAEVIYYLVQVGTTSEPNNPNSTLGTKLYDLYRAQFVMVPDGTNVSSVKNNAGAWTGKFANVLALQNSTFVGLSCNANPTSGFLDFFSPADAAGLNPLVTPTVKRIIPNLPQFNVNSANANVVTRVRTPQTETLVLPNVVSFQVQVMLDDLHAPNYGYAKGAFADVPLTGAPAVRLYDTSLLNAPAATYGNNFGLKAIQVTLRVFDPKTSQTRQVTVAQDL
jgi:prepilin-type N-terminal cleavage/methylation domain-containing protein